MQVSQTVWPVMALLLLGALPASTIRAEGVRSQAIANLTFDEASGNPLDSATAGAVRDNATLVNNPPRIRSHFPGQHGQQALLLDAGAKQFVQIADSADLDRPDAVSVSLFVANLQPVADGAYHGLFAKRDDAKTKSVNYGINFNSKDDSFQLYVNDGTGFKSAGYSARGSLGTRRPVYITAVFQAGDAPAPDADNDSDDLLVRFFANGRPVTPRSVTGGIVVGGDVWITDLKIAGLLNDLPVTLGASSPASEFTSCVIDEFSLFAKALTADEAAALFTEVALPGIAADTAAPPATTAPEIRDLSLRGLQAGQTTLLTVTGSHLQPAPQLVLPLPTERITLRPGGSSERVEFEVAVPLTAAVGHYPVRIRTPYGISGALTIAVDTLPQVAYGPSTAEKPAAIPAAFSGTLTGQEQHRIYFAGKTGQRVVVDLECKRLGAAMDPVLELRNPRGAPLNIAWGKPQYHGDTRIEATLFADGIYSVDLHDLAYKAPGQNAYRLKIGDLKIIDTTFPPAVAPRTQQSVLAIGPGMDPSATLPVDVEDPIPGIARSINLPPALGVVGPAPTLFISEGAEILEAALPEGQLQPVRALFTEHAHVPVVVNGRISQPGETDRYLVQVSPGMTLRFSIESHEIHSPLDPRLLVLSEPDGRVLATTEERPTLDFPVPAGVSQIVVAVRGLNRRGGPDYVYRLRIIGAGQPDFSLATDTERITLARDGTSLLRVDIHRAAYNGPITLSMTGAPELSIQPAEIPAGISKTILRISSSSTDPQPEALIRRVRLIGQSTGLEPPLRRTALAPLDSRLSLVPTERAELSASLTTPAGLSIEMASLPAPLFKGTEASFPVTLKLAGPHPAGQVVRLSLVTTESSRTAVDPTDPARRRRMTLPLVRSLPEQTQPASEGAGVMRVAVPLDVAETQLEAVVQAEILPTPFSDIVLSTACSAPFRLNVQSAVTVQPAANTLMLTGKAQTKFSGTVKRSPGFSEALDVAIVNLPAGYTAPKATLAADQEQFEIVVTAPAVTAAADLPKVALRVSTTDGNLLQTDLPLATKAAPGQ
jgi:hypothetical protein